MADSSQLEIRLSPQGRIVIPAEWRRQLGFTPGETLVARIEEGKLVMEKRENILYRLRSRFADLPYDARLADELIEDRRQEAARESKDDRRG